MCLHSATKTEATFSSETFVSTHMSKEAACVVRAKILGTEDLFRAVKNTGFIVACH